MVARRKKFISLKMKLQFNLSFQKSDFRKTKQTSLANEE